MMDRQDTEIPASDRVISIPPGERVSAVPLSDPNRTFPTSHRITEMEPDT